MRRAVTLFSVVVILLLVGQLAGWFYVAGQISQGYDRWAAERRAEGWTVSDGGRARAGWPLSAGIRLRAPALVAPGGVAWRAEAAVLRLDLAAPSRLRIVPEGGQALAAPGLPPVAVEAERLGATVDLTNPAATVDVAGVALRLATDAGAQPLTIGLLALQLRPPSRGDASPSLAVSAQSVTLPEALAPRLVSAFGPRLSSVSGEAALVGPLPTGAGARAAAATWRDGGGRLEVARLALGWGPLGLSGHLTARLDAALQPVVDGAARVVGYGQAFGALAQAGVVTPPTAAAATALLSAVARGRDNPGPDGVDIPISLRDGIVSAQAIPLARVPPLDWTRIAAPR